MRSARGAVLAAGLLAAAPSEAGVAALWAVGDGEKIERDEAEDPLKARNTVWDGSRVSLFAARNEIVAFQVIVEADAAGIASLSAVLPELRSDRSRIAYAVPAEDPSRFAGRPIQLFSVHYLEVTKETKAEWAWRPGSPAAPSDTTGMKPVVLVPENARAGKGGFPLRVGPRRNQALWVEVLTHRDLAPGVYKGEITVKADGRISSLPVELEVLGFTLPDENSLRAMVYYEPSQVELYHGRNLDGVYHRFAHRQRIELVHAYDPDRVRAHLGRFDGQDFIPARGYEGPGEGVGNAIVPASFYGPGREYEERSSAWKASDAWVSLLERTLPKALTFLYLPDEPYPPQYPEVRRLAENLHSNPGPGRRLPAFVTKAIVPELQGTIDIWCVPPQAYDIGKAEAERKAGRRVWFYNGGRPQGPTLLIDAPATDARVVAWAAFKHDVDLYFYWHGVHWEHNRQKQGERRQNVWAEPITFDNRGQPRKPVEDQGYLNGDGVLLYPGEERVHPSEDRGIGGPSSTVQLANLRRGLQDHLYLTLALAFDWLHGYPGFEASLKDRVAGELLEGAARMLALPSLADPAQASYHNQTLRELALAAFCLAAVEGHPSVEERAAPLREQARLALDNILETTELVDPEGSYHESMDYMRISWAPLALMAELRRTTTGEDPARRFSVFRNMGATYLYKVLPDGSTARDDDNEFPHLQALDNVVLGYAVHRFKDPFAAFLQKRSGWLPKEWDIPVLEFLWSDPTVVARDPAATTEAELPRARLFPGVGHLVMRSGFGPDATWIEFACGSYFAKHDHLDTNHFVIYRKGHLAVDAGADYTDTESPHYLNHYRRTVAHNTLLVYQPGERFFWGENRWPAANDGGQRMDSARFWNSVRSLEDYRRTRDLWDRGRIRAYDRVPEAYVYARGDGTRAYSPAKLERFERSLAYLPSVDVLFVLDRVKSRDAGYKKVWLLHGVSEPAVTQAQGEAPRAIGQGGTAHRGAGLLTFEDGGGRLRVHALLPRERQVVVRGGPGWEFWTPGDELGGPWGSGRNWPLDPPEGGPLPADPYLKKMWRTFWGADMERLAPSNRRAVVPGAWRLEVSPERPSLEDLFLHVLEIGDRASPARRIETTDGHRLAGATVDGGAVVMFATEPALEEAETTLPDVPSRFLLIVGLEPGALYDLQLTSSFAPGSPAWRHTSEANDAGVLHVPWTQKDGRLRLRRLGEERR